MSIITLTGRLICENQEQSARVRAQLPRHIELTRAEPGCLHFEVRKSDDPLVWDVTERFIDAASFAAHQARVGASEWGRETAGIARDYRITGLDADGPGAA